MHPVINKKISLAGSEQLSGLTNSSNSPRKMSTAPSCEGNIKVLDKFELQKDVMCSRFNPEGSLLAVGLSNGVIKVFSVESRTCVYSVANTSSELPVTCLRWRPDANDQSYQNVVIATYASGDVKQWHVSSGNCLWSVEENRQGLACSISSQGDRFLTGGSDAKVNLYDSSSRKLLNTFESSTKNQMMDGHTMRVFAVQFHPYDHNVFVSGGWDDTVQWWDVRQDPKHNIRKIVGPHICGEGLDIEPETLNIVTGSWRKDRNIQIWDFHSGNIIKEVMSDYNRSMIYCVQWRGQDTIIAGGSHCNMLRFVSRKNLQTTGRLMDLPGAIYTVDNNRKGNNPLVAIGSAENVYLVQAA